jgi:hypothetical protein
MQSYRLPISLVHNLPRSPSAKSRRLVTSETRFAGFQRWKPSVSNRWRCYNRNMAQIKIFYDETGNILIVWSAIH